MPGGEAVIAGECYTKHPKEETALAPRRTRGFPCDAFWQMCYRRPAGDLKPGKYTLHVAESNTNTITVVE